MHSRIVNIDGKKTTLGFGHEGALYKKSFVMYDKQTNSKWNHSTGLAMMGPLAGMQLKILPSRIIHWKTWKTIHPNTKVLARKGRWGFMGTYVGNSQPSGLGLSVGQGPKAKLFPFDILLKEEVVNEIVGPHQIVVVMDPSTREALAFSRKVNARVLTFKPIKARSEGVPLMRDQETGSVWNRLSGQAIEGPMKGAVVLPLISVPWLIERWRQIYQTGTIYRGS